MEDVLVKIKRLLLAGRYRFTAKAELEMLGDDLLPLDVLEAIINAVGVKKVVVSRSTHRRSRREKLYIIESFTYDGVFVYTKGTFRKEDGVEVYYLLISSKRSEQEVED